MYIFTMTFNIIPDDIISYELPKYDFWKLTIYDRYILDKFEFNKNNTFRVKYKFKNPSNYNIVNHIDGNKLNNNVKNLEWCTKEYNWEYSKEKQLDAMKKLHKNPEYSEKMKKLWESDEWKEMVKETHLSKSKITGSY